MGKIKASRIQPRKLKLWHVQEKDIVMKVKTSDPKTSRIPVQGFIKSQQWHAILVETKTMLVLRKIELFHVKKKQKMKIKASRIQPRKLKPWHVQEKDVVMKVKTSDP